MNRLKEIDDYFDVLKPHSAREHLSRDQQWARENESFIRKYILDHGPALYYAKVEIIKNSGIFTVSNAIDVEASSFFDTFGITRADLEGKRLLDVGAFAGSMSFFAEDAGSEVVAIDIQNPRTNGFAVIHHLRQSTVTHVMASIYDLHPDLFGTFDIVIFSGVHYHLKHPLLALERLNAVLRTGGELLTLGTSADFWLHEDGLDPKRGFDPSSAGGPPSDAMRVGSLNDVALLGFYKTTYLGDDSNWFIPNTRALKDMIAASGFEIISADAFPLPCEPVGRNRACSTVRARKISGVLPEYGPEVYRHLRKFAPGMPASTKFSIPTGFELDRAYRELRQCEQEKERLASELAAARLGAMPGLATGARQDSELAAVYASTSWRMTAPMRRIVEAVRRRRR